MEFVNGKDDIPYMIYGKYKNVPNHQPDYHCIYIYMVYNVNNMLTNGYMSYIPDDIIIYIYGIKYQPVTLPEVH
jgi:hypothetical protein